MYEKYKNDKTLEKVNMLEVARELKRECIIKSDGKFTLNDVITEFGICSSTTHLYKYQNPNEYEYVFLNLKFII